MKKIFLFAGVFVVSFVVFVMLLILFPPGSTTCDSKFIHYKDTINSIGDENLFWEISKRVPVLSLEQQILNSNISFNLGKNYTYLVWIRGESGEIVENHQTKDIHIVYIPVNYTLSFFVNDAVNLNNSKEKWTVKVVKKDAEGRTIDEAISRINKNGSVTGMTAGIFYIEEIFYIPWAAILKENISWKTMFNGQHSRNDKDLPLPCLLPDCNFSDITVYNTTSVEEFNGRKVFKVEKIQRTYNDCGWGSTGGFFLLNITIKRETNLIKSFFWIDVNERIVVKKETYDNNTLIYKAELL